MFLHVNQVKRRGRTYRYLRILETRYERGTHKQRVVANLGRIDKIASHLGELAKGLSKFSQQQLVAPEELRALDALRWGPVLLARHLWDKVGLANIIEAHCGSRRRGFDVAETAFVLVANRLTEPSSEHGLARWLESTYVCDRNGRRWKPDWRPCDEITPKQRVRVKHRQLSIWYRTLDAVLAARESIERALYLKVRDLFSLQVDMVLYDVTSTYFERRSPVGRLRRHGHSTDGRPRNVQVVLGVVMANGFPVAHHVFPGNTADKETLRQVVKDLEERFGLRRVLVVGDRGMVSERNLEFLCSPHRQLRYLLGLPGRRSQEAAQVLERLKDTGWERVDATNRVQAIGLGPEGVHYFVVESEQRKAYEQELRKRSMERAGEELKKIQVAVQSGRLKEPHKIGARAQKALCANHGTRYYCWELTAQGDFRFHEDEQKLAAERTREGRYILKTDDADLSPQEGVEIYKQLSDVEWAYRDLKDVIELRPIFHKTDRRTEAHIFVATVALFLKRTLEHELAKVDIALSPTQAFAAMQSIGVSVLDVGGDQRVLVSGGGRDARRLTRALGIENVNPPQPIPESEKPNR